MPAQIRIGKSASLVAGFIFWVSLAPLETHWAAWTSSESCLLQRRCRRQLNISDFPKPRPSKDGQHWLDNSCGTLPRPFTDPCSLQSPVSIDPPPDSFLVLCPMLSEPSTLSLKSTALRWLDPRAFQACHASADFHYAS